MEKKRKRKDNLSEFVWDEQGRTGLAALGFLGQTFAKGDLNSFLQDKLSILNIS